ncbi:MAG: N-acetyl-gamma-glutamyl-phosphate reductase [Actinomycetales bacterium]|nr:N-acetyl-gamma-glutamyl-phosphate reductase [Actinomycetales bacterium]
MSSSRALVAAVVGASGYAGGEVVRLLLGHPELAVGPLLAGGSAGARVTDLHPALTALAHRTFLATDVDAIGPADVVFLALPHGESGAVAAALPAGTLVVDLGADHRLERADAWSRYYGGDWSGHWTYGMPELPGQRAQIAASRRIANPGCYPTGVILGLSPLLAAGLVDPGDVVVVAASGTTGAGRKPSDALLASTVMGQLSTYKVGGTHQHTPEMEQALGAAAGEPVTLSFTPMLAPMPRGILATTTARLAPGVTTEVLHEALRAAYADEPFVSVLAPGSWPQTGATLGANSVHLQVAADLHAGRAVVVSAIDNLVKGAAGQAVQNANIALGLDESAGLTAIGVAP